MEFGSYKVTDDFKLAKGSSADRQATFGDHLGERTLNKTFGEKPIKVLQLISTLFLEYKIELQV